jgi:hypothetical protein
VRDEIEKLMKRLAQIRAEEKLIHQKLLEIYKEDLAKCNAIMKKKLQ